MDSNIVQTRLGHYHVPGPEGSKGYEHTALVVYADQEAKTVNLTVWQHDGDMYPRLDVPITGSPAAEDKASFHLANACPRLAVEVH